MAQDDYYYEIQLTNKQLVFYFMAGATGLILSFLAGVMVGRGVDAGTGAEVQAARLVREERIVPEEAKPAPPSTPAAIKPAPATTLAPKPPTATTPEPAAPSSVAAKPPAANPTGGAFTIQVGAFKDRATADSMVAKLKAKGFAAYVMTPPGGNAQLFNVRVGSFTARPDAERVQVKLRDEEKFKPFIVRN